VMWVLMSGETTGGDRKLQNGCRRSRLGCTGKDRAEISKNQSLTLMPGLLQPRQDIEKGGVRADHRLSLTVYLLVTKTFAVLREFLPRDPGGRSMNRQR
jgi:hypothetical protein